MPTMTTAAAPEAAASVSAGLWEDYIDIFIAPGDVFERRRDGRFGIALLVLSVSLAILYVASLGPLGSAYEAGFREGMAGADVGLTGDQLQNMALFGGMASVLIGLPIAVAVGGLIIWALSRLVGSVATVAVAIAISTFAQFPKILQSAVLLVQGLLLEPTSIEELSLGPLRFVGAEAAPLTTALLSRFDLFVLWSAVLVAVGVHVAGRVPKPAASAVAAVVWILAAVPAVVGALVAG